MIGVLPVNVHEKLSVSGSLCIAPNRVNARAVWFYEREEEGRCRSKSHTVVSLRRRRLRLMTKPRSEWYDGAHPGAVGDPPVQPVRPWVQHRLTKPESTERMQ